MKTYSLSLLGRIGSEKYDSLLRKATTMEGARELAANWINSPFLMDKRVGYNSQEVVLKDICTGAMQGLLFSQRPENIDFIRQMYQKEFEACTASNTRSPFISSLAGSMAAQDYISEYGLIQFSFLQSQDNIFSEELTPYYRKYRWQPAGQEIIK